ncbi:MAG: two-component system, OmpR family, sensor kinase [Betaproteobacteria bacterium]|nr:two-component system, OmpR family, sensor kinase [Betaproteobacteria bacterium]
MGRLFWKFFFALWCALLIAGVGAAGAIWLQFRSGLFEPPPPLSGHRIALDLAASALRYGGPEGLRDWLSDAARHNMPTVYAVNAAGEDVLGRAVPAAQVARARFAVTADDGHTPARAVATTAGEHYVVFAEPSITPRRPRFEKGPPGLRPGRGLWPWMHIVAGTLASLLVSALLAWYMARPIRNLRSAFDAAAHGHLETRVGPLMGRRRDEIADLGKDFDRMAEQLQRLMAAQRLLLHDVSHELRSPLARLQAAIGLLRQDPNEHERSLARIEREAMRLNQLVGELLTLARLDSGAITEALERLDLSDIVADIAEDAKFEAETSGRLLELSSLESAAVFGRSQLLHRAIENVVRNALQYTPVGTVVRIAVAVDRVGSRAVLTIEDHGPGIPEDELANSFRPFFRASSAPDGKGFGLGLAIARRAIEVHHGTIAMQNVAGNGLRVTIKLPLAAS